MSPEALAAFLARVDAIVADIVARMTPDSIMGGGPYQPMA